MSRILLTALLGVGLLTGCPVPGADSSGLPDGSTPTFKTQTSVTLSLTGAVLRVAHVETALFKLEGDTEVAIPSSALTHDRGELPRAIPLTDLAGESTYRLKAQAFDASSQAVASGALAPRSAAATSNLNAVYKLSSTGTLSTVAGTGGEDYAGDGGLAVDAALSAPEGLALDASGNLYIADTDNGLIRSAGFRIRAIEHGGRSERLATRTTRPHAERAQVSL